MAHRNPRIRLLAHGFARDFSDSTTLIFCVAAFLDAILGDRPYKYHQYDRAIATVRGRRDTALIRRFLYGGRDGVPNFSHDIQEFLCLLLALNERKNFGLCTYPSFELNAPPARRDRYRHLLSAVLSISCNGSLPSLSIRTVLLSASNGTVGPLLDPVGSAIL
jgi:hypothetical protein